MIRLHERKVMKVACAFTAALAVSLFTTAAMAAPSEGELLFREGRAAMQDKNFERACMKFAESQKKEPAPGTALNLGDCEEQRGHLIAAVEAFTLAASTYASPDKQKYATGRAEAADRRIPRLTVRASNPAPGLVVHVGSSVIPVDTEVKMDPGDIVIRAEAPGRRTNTLKATLREGKNTEIEIRELETAGSGSSDSGSGSGSGTGGSGDSGGSGTRKKLDTGGDLRPIGLIIAGVGVASLAVGAVTGVLTLDKASTVESKCGPDLQNCDQEGKDAADSGGTLATVSTITVAAGAALVIGGGVLYFLSPRPAKATGAVRLTPTASHEGAGFLLRGTF